MTQRNSVLSPFSGPCSTRQASIETKTPLREFGAMKNPLESAVSHAVLSSPRGLRNFVDRSTETSARHGNRDEGSRTPVLHHIVSERSPNEIGKVTAGAAKGIATAAAGGSTSSSTAFFKRSSTRPFLPSLGRWQRIAQRRGGLVVVQFSQDNAELIGIIGALVDSGGDRVEAAFGSATTAPSDPIERSHGKGDLGRDPSEGFRDTRSVPDGAIRIAGGRQCADGACKGVISSAPDIPLIPRIDREREDNKAWR
ncbi:hypothetical protein MAPG_02333 [Magnaporthiopsis poae ATCC 64411]|uniref:Uncharacterized protein n=1 Tax=Magnaporthiopsis poae (strain ATCC 64411 / 73-15) TaxID=644358 RepID=A0A0C4DR32_MAGP6|nr:hypothetical protein MAPG_02333 [Magnaporthiopsis poae ATCC 64411]